MTASLLLTLCLLTAEPPTLVVVGMDGCQACHDLWGTIEKMAPTRNKLGWKAEYYDAFDDASEAYVRGLGAVGVFPQVLLFKDGKLAAKTVGAMSDRELVSWLAAHGVVTLKPAKTVRGIIEVPVSVEVCPGNCSTCPNGSCGRR